jgi:predicted 2-oxoglutarate/Fe(II)-dependent dioxygenase YbiX/peroxiredoxin
MLNYGEAVPHFTCATLQGNPTYAFDSAAGRLMLLLVHGSGAWPASAEAIRLVDANRDLFDDQRAIFFGVSIDPADASEARIVKRMPGIRWFLDYDRKVSRLLGAITEDGENGRFEPHWLLIDRGMRVLRRAPVREGEAIIGELRRIVGRGMEQRPAPVLIVPRVFEPEVCKHLIGLYEQHGGTDSGFMREENGMTVPKLDHSFKRRADYTIADAALIASLRERLRLRLLPEIAKAFDFRATRIERWIVARYDAESGGFFRAHRDNTTAGTAHRRFACTINLNAEGFEGGELGFPEYGDRTYRAPTGGAVVFSCSLLHEAHAVTRGKRYAFLPFLYDEAHAQVRERNQHRLHRESPAPTSVATAG